MAKVGILTFHRSHNYGAVLQAYALQKYLQEKGHIVELIDYMPEGKVKWYSKSIRYIPKSKNPIKFLRNIIHWFLTKRRREIRYDGFESFINNHITLSKPYSTNLLKSEELDYDLILVGSDQVWRKSHTFEGYNIYWGNLQIKPTTKLVSYAASMEVESLSESQAEFCRKNLCNFNLISVRESNLQQLLQPLSSKTISIVLDPTLLLNMELYKQIMQQERIEKDKYILIYQVGKSPIINCIAEKLAKYHNCKIVEIMSDAYANEREGIYDTLDPSGYLRLIKDAEVVITTSFHGTAFSLIFEKQFYTIGMKNRSSRAYSLLQMAGIPERLVYSIEQVDVKSTIDFVSVQENIKNKRSESYLFIDSALQGNY